MSPARARSVHLVVAVVAWAAVVLQLVLVLLGSAGLVGPRPRIGVREAAYALCWPLAWLAWTLAVGEVDGWVPYPFLDAGTEGWGAVAVVSLGITALFLLLLGAFGWLDRRLAAVPRSDPR